MKIYLAGCSTEILNQIDEKINVLESFAYIQKHKKNIDALISNNFLLDSGAFTFFGNQKISLQEYIDKYIEFINVHKIDLFFELDLYTLSEYGIKKTEEIRSYIELKTGKKTIPVFHKMLGIEYYKQLCENYKYIAISASGMYDSKWTRTNPEQLKKMVLYANKKNVKVHGLGYTKMNELSNIPFYSLCEHHTAPFFGVANIAYIPNGKIVGLSKLARTVDLYANRFQNQERITTQIAERLQTELKPLGVAVTLKAQHLCMCMRGVKKHDTWTTTSKMIGAFKTDLNARNEFLSLIKNG